MSARMDGVYTLGILGGGRAAWAYGSTWRRLGWPIDGVWLRPESQSRLPELLDAPRKAIGELRADLLLIAVSDRAIGEVVALVIPSVERGTWAGGVPPTVSRNPTRPGPSLDARDDKLSPVLFHASGALPAPPGGFSLHPLK